MKTFRELIEAYALGSFEDMTRKVSDSMKSLIGSDPFQIKVNEYGDPIQKHLWIAQMYLDRAIVEWMGEYYSVSYKFNKKGVVSLGDVKKVDQLYESVEQEIKECDITITESAKGSSDIDIGFVSLKEAKFDADTGEIEAILIEAGTNPHKKRHYPNKTIKEAAQSFSGLKMYINHPTRAEEASRPERDIRDWASTIVESWYEDGKAMAKIAVHDEWLRERMKDPVAREHIGLSINAGGRISYGKVQGQEMQIVEKIILERPNGGSASVDWVTEAGARGRVSRLLKESTGREHKMELHEAKIEDIQRENPTLIKSIREAVVAEIKESEESKKSAQELKESREKIAAYERKEKLSAQKDKVSAMLKESKAPDAVKERVLESMTVTLFESDEALKESFTSAMKKELDYANKFSTKGAIQTGATSYSASDSLIESSQKQLDSWMGIKEEKTKE